ncbi:MAG: MFS transporter [Negativicutes bacterium]
MNMENARGMNKPVPQKATKYRWMVLFVMWLAYLMCFADRGNIGIVLPVLRTEFSLTNMEAGALMSFMFIGYSITQIPAGFYVSKYGTRGLVSIAVLGFSVFTALIGTAASAGIIKWFRVGLGLFEGLFPIGATSTIKNWFPPKERGFATGIYMAATNVAAMLTPPVAVWIMINYGWRWVFYLFALPGIITAILWYFLVRTRPEEMKACNAAEVEYINDTSGVTTVKTEQKSFGLLDTLIRAKTVTPIQTNAKVLTNWNVWGITLSYFFAVSIYYGMVTWIPSYLVNAKGFSLMKMGWVSIAPWVGGSLGAIAGGWISDNIFAKRRKPTMWVTGLATAAMMFVLINVPENLTILTITLFMSGFLMNIGWGTFTAYPMGLTTNKTYPVAISILNTGGNIAGFTSPIIAGYLLDTYKSYDAVFMFFAACGIICWLINCTIEEPINY